MLGLALVPAWGDPTPLRVAAFAVVGMLGVALALTQYALALHAHGRARRVVALLLGVGLGLFWVIQTTLVLVWNA